MRICCTSRHLIRSYVFQLSKRYASRDAYRFLTTRGGLCSDRLGNVWVANASTESGEGYLVEYAHGGMTPIATLSDTGESPVACSIDPSTGNLAAANCPDRDCASTVAIYARAQGTPTQIPTGPSMGDPFEYYTYDNSGNIFVAAEIDFFDHKIRAELPNGQSQFQIFTMEPKTLSSGNVKPGMAPLRCQFPQKTARRSYPSLYDSRAVTGRSWGDQLSSTRRLGCGYFTYANQKPRRSYIGRTVTMSRFGITRKVALHSSPISVPGGAPYGVAVSVASSR